MIEGCSWVVHLTALGLLCAVAVGGIVSFLDSGFPIATAQSTDGLLQNYSCLRMLATGPLFRPTPFGDDYAVGDGFFSAALPWQMVFGLPGF